MNTLYDIEMYKQLYSSVEENSQWLDNFLLSLTDVFVFLINNKLVDDETQQLMDEISRGMLRHKGLLAVMFTEVKNMIELLNHSSSDYELFLQEMRIRNVTAELSGLAVEVNSSIDDWNGTIQEKFRLPMKNLPAIYASNEKVTIH